jgi:anti-anti-sigma factor
MSGGTDPSQHLDVTASQESGGFVLRLVGELDVHTAPQLSGAIESALGGGTTAVAVDATDLRFCDSSGLQALVAGREKALAAGGSLVVRGVHGPVEKVLSVTGLLDLLTS